MPNASNYNFTSSQKIECPSLKALKIIHSCYYTRNKDNKIKCSLVHGNHTSFETYNFRECHPRTVLLIFALLVDASCRHYKVPPIPSTLATMLAGFFGTLVIFAVFGRDYAVYVVEKYTWAYVGPQAIELLLLPVIIFDAAFRLDSFAFREYAVTILSLAIVGFAGAAMITGGIVYIVENVALKDSSWNIYISMAFGSMMCATDPIAVTSLFKELGAPHDLHIITEGESLFNDGVAIISYQILQYLVAAENGIPVHETTVTFGAEQIWEKTVVKLSISVVPIIIAYAVAEITSHWLMREARNTVPIRLAMVVVVYVLFAGTQRLNGGGVLAIVCFGLFFNRKKDRIDAMSYDDMQNMFAFLAFAANAMIFGLTGVLAAANVGRMGFSASAAKDFGLLTVAYVASLFARATVIAAYKGIMVVAGQHVMSWRKCTMLWWAGLRGAIPLLLAMEMRSAEHVGDLAIRDKLLIYVVGNVLLSLSIQGCSAGRVIKLLKLDEVTLYRRKIMHDLVADVNKNIEAATITTQTAFRELASANWEKFDKLVRLENPYEVKHKHKQMFEAAALKTRAKSDSKDGKQGTTSIDLTSEVEETELYDDVKHRIQNVFNAQLHQLHSTGALSYRAYQDLVGALRKIDNDIESFDIEYFIYSKEPSSVLQRLVTRIQGYRTSLKGCTKSRPWIRKWIFATQQIISINIIHIIIAILTASHFIIQLCVISDHASMLQMYQYEISKFGIVAFKIYLYFLLAKHHGIRSLSRLTACYSYIFSLLHMVDFVISWVAIIIHLTSSLKNCYGDMTYADRHSTQWTWDTTVCLPLAYAELAESAFVLVPYMFLGTILILNCITYQLDGYVKSYYAQRMIAVNGLKLATLQTHRRVYANRFLSELRVRHIVDDIIAKYDKVAKEAEFCSAKLQVEHPRIAVGVKTQITAMRFLYDQRLNIDEKREEGIIEESEADLLKVQINRKWTAISSHTQESDPLPFERAISFHPSFGLYAIDLLLFVKPEYKKYDPDDYILVQGQPSNGMYYIYSGICKFSRNKAPPGTGMYFYAGDSIGEVSVLFDEVRAGNVIAVTTVETYRFDKKDILMFLQKHKDLQDRLIKNYCVQRAAEYLRTTTRYRSWTEFRLMALLRQGDFIDLYKDPKWHYMDLHGSERILLLRGVVMNERGKKFDAGETAANPIEVTDDRLRSIDIERHCLFFLVPRRDAATKLGGEAPGAVNREEVSEQKSITANSEGDAAKLVADAKAFSKAKQLASGIKRDQRRSSKQWMESRSKLRGHEYNVLGTQSGTNLTITPPQQGMTTRSERSATSIALTQDSDLTAGSLGSLVQHTDPTHHNTAHRTKTETLRRRS